DPIEQRGVAGKAHAAECAEELLHAVWDEDRAERDAQDRFGIFVDRAVNVAERGNVVMRFCFGHRHAPSMVLFLACAFTGRWWAKAAALDESLEDKLIGGGGRCKEPCDRARRALPGCHSGIATGATPCGRTH